MSRRSLPERTSRNSIAEAEIFKLLSEISKHSDREVAIVAATAVEEFIERLIRVFLRDLPRVDDERLFGPAGPLGNFAWKIQLAYGMRLIEKTARDDLDVIRHVRNRFAHELTTATFGDDDIRRLIEKLKLMSDWHGRLNSPDRRVVDAGGPSGEGQSARTLKPGETSVSLYFGNYETVPKDRFIASVYLLTTTFALAISKLRPPA